MLGFLTKPCKTIIRTKFFRSFFPNPLVWYIYGRHPRNMFLVHMLAKIDGKILYFIKLGIEPNPNRKSNLTAIDCS